MNYSNQEIRTVVIVPCFNEEKRIDSDAFIEFLSDSKSVFVLFVDDGSRDHTLGKLESIQQTLGDRFVEVLSLPRNRGKAEAIRQGMLKVLSGDFQHKKTVRFAGYLDADLATPLSEVERLVDVAVRCPSVQMVLGSRLSLSGHAVRRQMARNLIGKTFSFISSRLIGIPVLDTQCGAKIFRMGGWLRAIFDREFSDRWLFDVEILARVKACYGKRASSVVYECPLESWQEIGGSKLKVRDFLKAPISLLGLAVKYRMIGFPATSTELSDLDCSDDLVVSKSLAMVERSTADEDSSQSRDDSQKIPVIVLHRAA